MTDQLSALATGHLDSFLSAVLGVLKPLYIDIYGREFARSSVTRVDTEHSLTAAVQIKVHRVLSENVRLC